MEKDKFDFGRFIEKYKLFIGGFLLSLILVGSGVLLWQANYVRPSLESKLSDMESEISSMKVLIKNSSAPSPNEVANIDNSTFGDQSGAVAGAATEATQESAKTATKVAGKINLNTATEAELDTLNGIGPTYAKRIVEYRSTHGGFKSIEEIKNVKGIGDKTFEKFKDNITI